jgi:methyltransferase (TIGR00027 family)
MREGKPSFTAAAVAAARGAAGVDPLAIALVDGPLGVLMRAGRGGGARARAVNVATLGLIDHIEMRTRAIDAAVREGVEAGARQLVVLGAGLDARAWRMPELADVAVFEVDHPSTQEYKRARVGARVPEAKALRFVAVDFAKDALGEALQRARHDATLPTIWLWEGVTPYLPIEAVRATLGAVAARSPRASRIAVTYGTPRASSLGSAAVRVALLGFRALGEPIVGLISAESMRAELEAVGFGVQDDSEARDWAARFGGGKPRLMLVEERLAVAVNDGPLRV